MPLTSAQAFAANQIKDRVEDLNFLVRKAAEEHGITTEYLLDNVVYSNAPHQSIKVVLSERV